MLLGRSRRVGWPGRESCPTHERRRACKTRPREPAGPGGGCVTQGIDRPLRGGLGGPLADQVKGGNNRF